MAFKKAVKEQARLRLALGGIAGTGKTYSALAIATAMARMMRESGHGEGRIAVIDTERGSASLYADKFEFDVCELDSFSPLAYVDKIKEAESAGYDFVVIDSLSHAWAGKDGALDQKDKAAERSSSGNSWTAWAKVTPKQNALIDAMLQSRAHVIATMRQKMKHVQSVDEKGKTKIEKVGLELVQRDQIEFEFTLVGEIDHTHTLKISKTRVDGIDLDDQFEKPGETFARKIYGWLMSGAVPRPTLREAVRDAAVGAVGVVAAVAALADAREAKRANGEQLVANSSSPVADALDEAFEAFLAGMRAATTQRELELAAGQPGKPEKGTPKHAIAGKVYLACAGEIKRRQQQAPSSGNGAA